MELYEKQSNEYLYYDDENRISIFRRMENRCCDTPHIYHARLENGIKINAKGKDGYLEEAVILSGEDKDIFLYNNFQTDLIAVTDDVKSGRFDDRILKLYPCGRGEYLKISVKKGITYIVTSVL